MLLQSFPAGHWAGAHDNWFFIALCLLYVSLDFKNIKIIENMQNIFPREITV
jgi:hypothetical protein